jgi:lytic murein transglycosylase
MRKILCAWLVAAVLPVAHAEAITDWKTCLSRLRAGAPVRGVSRADFDRLTRGSDWQASTIDKSEAQAEFTIDWPTYLARVVTSERIAAGRVLFATWKDALSAIADRYAVDPATVLAIWGVESSYGKRLGEVPVLDAWITRSCIAPQKQLWRDNVYAALRLLRDGVVAPDTFKGSWSGAFGLTQFIPTSFEQYARDGDGDGRIDLYASVPDALASTANHLGSRTTWRRGVPAAIEVEIPASLLAGVPQSDEWRDPKKRPLADWAARGVTRAGGGALPVAPDAQQLEAAAFFPEGTSGRAFLVTQNFDALLGYNRAAKYALSVALIAAAIEAP